MSDVVADKEQSQLPATTYLKNYQQYGFNIESLELVFDLDPEKTTVISKMKIKKMMGSARKHLLLNGEEVFLDKVILNGSLLSADQYTLSKEQLLIKDVPEQFEIEIHSQINPSGNTALSGLYRSGGAFCTQCEAEGFRRITFYPDRPDVLTAFRVKIIADKAQNPYLLSNGNLIEQCDLEDGKHYVIWEDPFKKPCYLFALVAGDFDLIKDEYTTMSGRKVSLQVYTDKGYGDQTGFAIESLKQAMQWDEQKYGREYDLDIYMIAAMGDFNMGAMENKGLNIFNTKYVLAKPETATDQNYILIQSVIGHEYFHNWTGNRVTCRDWFQLSLKEGLTIFRDQTFSQDMLSQPVMRIKDVMELRDAQFPEDAGPLAHPVRPESYIEINNFYTATVYNKGAEVLRMLTTMMGDKAYRKAMDLYFERYDGQAVTIDDYVAIMQEVSGLDLTQFKLWYSQAGTPHVLVDADYDASEKTYTLRINQSCADSPGQTNKEAFHIPIKMSLLDENGNTLPLMLEGQGVGKQTILHLKDKTQVFKFENIDQEPIPSLLQGFTAPVKLLFDYSMKDLLLLYRSDPDEFNRWEAGQRYFVKLILSLVKSIHRQQALGVPDELFDVIKYHLEDTGNDLYYLSELISLPSENYLADQMEVVDIEAIHQAREFVKTAIAEALSQQFLAHYKKYHSDDAYHFSFEEASRRFFKNVCLGYLSQLEQYTSLVKQQFEGALNRNMTDLMAAFNLLINKEGEHKAQAVAQFYKAYKGDALVVDKWFAAQAGSHCANTLQTVKELMRHPDFDIKNPNKVYALIASFAFRNLLHFHSRSGEGYAFVAEVVQTLDKLNPQIAARMAKSLTQWRRYDTERQAMLCKQLQYLLDQPSISADLYEVVSKSLNK